VADFKTFMEGTRDTTLGKADIVLGAAAKKSPDTAAKATELGEAFGAPTDMVEKHIDRFEQSFQSFNNRSQVESSPALQKFVLRDNNADVISDDITGLAIVDNTLKAFRRFFYTQQEGAATLSLGKRLSPTSDKSFMDFLREARERSGVDKRIDGRVTAEIGAAYDAVTEWRANRIKRAAEEAGVKTRETALSEEQQLQQLTAIQQKVAANAFSEAAQKFTAAVQSKGYSSDIPMVEQMGKFFDAVSDEPFGFTAFLAETAAEFVPAMLAGGAIGLVTRSPAAFPAVSAGAAFTMEATRGVTEFVTERGIDPTDHRALIEAFKDPNFIKEAEAQGLTRGLVIAAATALGASIAGRQLTRGFWSNQLTQGGVQGMLDAGGEALARSIAGQKQDFMEIFIEFAAGGLTAPLETAVAVMGKMRADARNANGAKELPEALKSVRDALGGTKLMERLPQKAKEFVSDAVDGTDLENLYVPAEKFEEYAQTLGTSGRDLISQLGLSEEEWRTAVSIGGDIAIPTAVYVTELSTPSEGEGTASFLDQHVKLEPDQMTFAEAEAFDTTAKEEFAEVMEAAEAIAAQEGALAEAEQRILDTMTQRLTDAGRSPLVAADEAAVYPAFYRAMAARAGVSVDQFTQTFPLPDVVQATDEISAKPGKPADAVELEQSIKLRVGDEDLTAHGLEKGGKHLTREVARALQERTVKKHGKIDPKDRSGRTSAKIAKWIADEVAHEIAGGSDAVGWYSDKFQRAIDTFEGVFPELGGDTSNQLPGVALLGNQENARNFFTALIAITSDGQKVVSNLSMASSLYSDFRQTATLPETFTSGGGAAVSIATNLNNLSTLLDRYGPAGMHEYLMQERKVSELKKIFAKMGLKFVAKHPANSVMPLAAVALGPKIGVFYANLMGAEGYLTMDRWWNRAFNRYRGDLLTAANAVGLDRLRGLLIDQEADVVLFGDQQPPPWMRFTTEWETTTIPADPDDIFGMPEEITMRRALPVPPGELTDAEVLDAARYWAETYKRQNYKNGSDVQKAANTIFKDAFEKLKDSPGGIGDRGFMIATAERAQARLKKAGIDISIADMQAVLWYYEKRLYGEQGARQTQDISYEDIAARIAQTFGPDGRPTGALPNVAERPGVEDGGERTVDGGLSSDFDLELAQLVEPQPEAETAQAPTQRGRVHFGRLRYPRGVHADEFIEGGSVRNLISIAEKQAGASVQSTRFGTGGWTNPEGEIEVEPSSTIEVDGTPEQIKAFAQALGQMGDQFSMLVIGEDTGTGQQLVRVGVPKGFDVTPEQLYAVASELDAKTYGGFSEFEDTRNRGAAILTDTAPDIEPLKAAFEAAGIKGVQVDMEPVTGEFVEGGPDEFVDPATAERLDADLARTVATGPQAPVNDAGLVQLSHFSEKPLTSIDPAKFGTRTTGRLITPERRRSGPDKSFYGINVGRPGGYRKEGGVGDVRHDVAMDPARLYNVDVDAQNLSAGAADTGAFEEAIKAAGFDGYWSRSVLGDVAVLFTPQAPVNVASDPDGVGPQQELRQGRRGSIMLLNEPGKAPLIKLFEQASLSTFLHESGHFFLDVLERTARAPDAPEAVKADYAVVKKWWRDNAKAVAKDGGSPASEQDVIDLLDGKTLSPTVHRAVMVGMQEQWARAFEAYLLAGEAPSVELRSVFARFRAWLLSVYRNVSSLNVDVSPQINGVFDRMLATDSELAQLRETDTDSLMFKSAQEMGVTEQEYADLQSVYQKALDAAEMQLTRDAMAPIRAQRKKGFAEQKENLRGQVETEVNAQPVYRAFEWLANSRWLGNEDVSALPMFRLNAADLKENYGYTDATLQQLPTGDRNRRVYGPAKDVDTATADEAASWFGFESGQQLLDSIKAAAPRKQVIEDRLNNLISGAAGADPLGTPAIAQAAQDAVHNEHRGQVLARELAAVNKKIGAGADATTTAAVARRVAKQTMARMVVRSAEDPNRFVAAERKARRDADKAVTSGDFEAAAEAKQREILSWALYSESRKVAREVGKTERLARRLKRKGTRKNLAGQYLAAIDELLEAYDFRKLSRPREQLVLSEGVEQRAALKAYLQSMEEQGRLNEMAIPEHVINATGAVPYKMLTVEHLRGVYDSLKNIEHTARNEKKLIDAEREREMDVVVADIEGAFATSGIKKRPPSRVQTKKEQRHAGFRQYVDIVASVESMMRDIDGHENLGPVYRALKMGIDKAAVELTVMQREAGEAFDALYKPYSTKEKRQMSKPTVKHGDSTLSKWDVISIALNVGNEDNLNRLLDPANEGSVTPAQLNSLLALLDKRDWDFVQNSWDMIDKYWDLIAERERRVTGVVPEKVQAVPVQTPYGTLRGGYYPIKYDPRLNDRTHDYTVDELESQMRGGNFGKAQTRSGHTKGRVGSGGQALMLDIGVVHSHVSQVIHDLAMSEEVTNAWRIVKDPRVRDAFRQYGRFDDLQAMEAWLKDTAAGEVRAGDLISKVSRKAKSGFTMSKLLFNMSTVAIQTTGIGQSMVVVGKKNMAKAVIRHIANGARGADVIARSKFMRDRQATFNKDIYDLMGDLKGQGSLTNPVQKFISEWVSPAGFWAMQKVQFYTVDLPTWMAGYEQGINEGMSVADAEHHADRSVARSQASGLFSDRTSIERGRISATKDQNDFVRLWSTLGSYMFAKFNAMYEATGKTDFKDPLSILNYMVDMLLLFTLEGIAYSFLSGRLPDFEDDDESWAKFAAEETLFSILGTLPFGRDAASGLQGFDTGGAYGSILETLTKPMVQTWQGEMDEALFKSYFNATGLATGLPSTSLWRIFDAASRQAGGDEVSPAEYIFGKPRRN
jgi:hypothetical protein